jgi:hypothetical protein
MLDQMKSKMSFSQTKELVDLASGVPLEIARDTIFEKLKTINISEGQFFDAIEEHVQPTSLTSEQWLRLFRIYPSRFFCRRFDLSVLLSEKHLKQLQDEQSE